MLAGGRSSRFGRDKLAEPLDGRPLLDRAIEAVLAVAIDIVVVSRPDTTPTVPPGIRVAHDPRPFEGPLAGLAAGLAALDPGTRAVIVVAGDMPRLVPAVLDALATALAANAAAGAAVLGHGDDRPPLPMAVERIAATEAASRLLDAGERSLRALIRDLGAVVVAEADWRHLDPTAGSLLDVDAPGDLPT